MVYSVCHLKWCGFALVWLLSCRRQIKKWGTATKQIIKFLTILREKLANIYFHFNSWYEDYTENKCVSNWQLTFSFSIKNVSSAGSVLPPPHVTCTPFKSYCILLNIHHFKECFKSHVQCFALQAASVKMNQVTIELNVKNLLQPTEGKIKSDNL